jgi:hypothetical protein
MKEFIRDKYRALGSDMALEELREAGSLVAAVLVYVQFIAPGRSSP